MQGTTLHVAEEPNVTIETEITDAALSEYGGAVKAALIIFFIITMDIDYMHNLKGDKLRDPTLLFKSYI